MPRVPCRFWARGGCARGNACNFEHDPAARQSLAPVCRFFQQGHCAYGESCRFKHELPDEFGTQAWLDQEYRPPSWEEDYARHYLEYLDTHSSESQSLANEDQSYAGSESVGLPLDCPSFPCSSSESSFDDDAYSSSFHFSECSEEDILAAADMSRQVNGHPIIAPNRQHVMTMLEYALEGLEGLSDGSEDPDSDGRFKHEKWEALARERGEEDFQSKSICQAWSQNGKCPFWKSCPHAHGHRCETCSKWCLHPYNRTEAKNHVRECTARMEREASRICSEQQECCICLEHVSDKPPTLRKFGLLSCNHCFCLGCVRDWRSQKDGEIDQDTALRCCPVCRQRTDFVTPSKVWPQTEQEKKSIIEGYRARLATINCRYWMRSPEDDRRCPFGTSCFYHHPGQRKKLRVFETADGDIRIGGDIHLSDFLRNIRL